MFECLQIIRRANEHKEKNPEDPLSDPLKLSDHYCQEFLKDMDDLQCLLPTHQPRVSDHMDQIRDMIAKVENVVYMSYLCLGAKFSALLATFVICV